MDLRTGGMLKTPVVVFTSLSLLLSLSCAGDVISRSCSDVRQAFTTKGFNLHSVPHQEIPGENVGANIVPHHKTLATSAFLLTFQLDSGGEQLVLMQKVCLQVLFIVNVLDQC